MEGSPTSWKIVVSPTSKNSPRMVNRRRNKRLKEMLCKVYMRSPKEPVCPCRECMDKRISTKVSRMLEAESLYKPSSPQQPTVKRRRLRLCSVPLVDLRTTTLSGSGEECEEIRARLSISNFLSSDLVDGNHLSTSGTWFGTEGMEGTSSVRIKHLKNSWEGQSRFPKLDECAHFHYEFIELGPIQVCLYDEAQRSSKLLSTGDEERNEYFPIQITSMGKTWVVRRTYDNFCLLDERLHQCIYDRKFSALPELTQTSVETDDEAQDIRILLSEYLERFSTIAGSLISCGPILNWFELDNRGNRLIVTDESAINTPAVAAAYVVKRYLAQATDEISFEVGDMISVIDMPPPEESVWWRGKKGFEVGFFPCECVEVIGDKLPQSINIPRAPTKPVLRKHGKLISFFRSFILSRPSRRKLKQSGILKERVFGCDLGEHLLNTQRDMPMVLTCCSKFIEEHGIVDGIYRLSGVTSNIQKLRNSFDEDQVPNLNDSAIVQDIHCVASLLKMYFRELPNPLLTYQLYDKFVSAVQTDDSVRLLNMRDVVQQLPPPHYRTLEYLIRHLACVASHGAETGMTPKNIAIVWAPNLLRSKELEIGSVAALQVVGVQAIVTEYLIRYVDLIFNDKIPTFCGTKNSLGTPKKTRPKSLAISTPTKLLSLEEARSRALSTSSQPQQKYIEVGGGAATLPSKYHTVIELPHRKRGSAKLKKSPSGWKSFFSKGKQLGKEKTESLDQTDSVIRFGINDNPAKETFTQNDSSMSAGKQLRSVKSAESLGSFTHTFSILDDTSLTLDSTKLDVIKRETLNPRSSPHTHVRSMSHDSYFELTGEDETKIDMVDTIPEVKHFEGSNEGSETPSLQHPGDETSKPENNRSPKKHRWKQSDTTSISPKTKLSLKAKLKQAFSSPPSARRADESNETKKEKWLRESAPEFTSKLSGIDNLGVENDDEPTATNSEKIVKWMADEQHDHMASSNVVVERYGSEKTVIVEVHATQESEEEDGEERHKKPEVGSPTSVMATISDNETLSATAVDEMSDGMIDTSLADCTSDTDWIHPDSEVSTPKSFSADVLDSEIFSALAFRLDDTFFYRKSVDGEPPEITIRESPIPEIELVPSPALTTDLSESTPSPATSGDGAVTGNCDEKEEKRYFGYSVLIDELESGLSEEEKTPGEKSEKIDECETVVEENGELSNEDVTEIEEKSDVTSLGDILDEEFDGRRKVAINLMSPDEEIPDIDFSPPVTSPDVVEFGETDKTFEVMISPDDTRKVDSSFVFDSLVDSSRLVDNLPTPSEKKLDLGLFDPCLVIDSLQSPSEKNLADEGKCELPLETNIDFGLVDSSAAIDSPVSPIKKKVDFGLVDLTPVVDSFQSPMEKEFEIGLIDTSSIIGTLSSPSGSEKKIDSSPVIDSLQSPSGSYKKLDFGSLDSCLTSPSESIKKFDLSPVEYTKRKFESEIGRDILHERKMKLELEKIQVEQRLMGPPSDAKLKAVQWANFPRGSEFAKVKLATIVHDDASPELEEVEFRRQHSGATNNEDPKRNSEPIFHKPPVQNGDRKRHSEPQMRCAPTTPPDRKTSVKELLSKFEATSPTSPTKPKTPLGECTNSVGAGKPPVAPTHIPKSSSVINKSPVEETECVFEPQSLHLSFVADVSPKRETPDPMTTSTDEKTETGRRERIEKYKEERRAQLREKIRSESFRMSRDEKSEYATRRRGKSSNQCGSPESDENVVVSYGSLRKTRLGDGDAAMMRSLRRSSASAGETGNLNPTGIASPSRSRRLSYDATRPTKNTKPRLKWPPSDVQSTQQCDDLPLRSSPGRRSLRLTNEAETEKGPTKVLRRRGSLIGSREVTARVNEKAENKSGLVKSTSFEKRRSEVTKPKISPRMEVKSYPVEGVLLKSLGATTKKCASASGASPRKIKDVAAIFEKDSSSSSSATSSASKSATSGAKVIATRARYLPRNNDNSPDQNGHGKANQYLSAV